MSSLPHDELLSAYLDGELNAAERAEAERLLATDPAARRLFEELKAMSEAVRALPQEKIGRDISRQVLRAAERRMLTEGEPNKPAEPLARRILRRATNPHTLFWLSITTAVAVMIAIHERQQKKPGVENAAREIAFSATKSESSSASATSSVSPAPTTAPRLLEKGKSDIPPSIQAYREPAKDRELGRSDAVLAESATVEGGRADKSAPASKSDVAAATKPAASRLAGKIQLKSSKSGEEHSFRAVGGMTKAAANQSPKNALGIVADGASGLASVRNLRDRQMQTGVGQAALVVYCDISPEAARNKAFDKLLDANGIQWHRQAANGKNAADSLSVAKRSGDKWAEEKSKPETAAKQKVAQRKEGGQQDAEDKKLDQASERYEYNRRAGVAYDADKRDTSEDVIYVEATPAQVNAALAGLAAQPDVFLAVSFGTPARQKVASGQWPVASETGGRGQGPGASKTEAFSLQSPASSLPSNPKFPIPNPRPPAAQSPPPATTPTAVELIQTPQSSAAQPQAPQAAQAELRQQQQQPVSIQQPQQSQPQSLLEIQAPAWQRVVFVLRVSSLSPDAAKARANTAPQNEPKP